MPRYPMVMEVVEVKGDLPPRCPVHVVGDRIVINNGCIEGKMCLPVMAQYVARIYGLCNGMPGPNQLTIRCPDQGKVVYQLRRDPTRWWKDAQSPLTAAEVQP